MTMVRTQLVGTTQESARRWRVERGKGIISTDVQKALEQLATTPQAIDPTPVAPGSTYDVTKFDTVLLVDTSGGPVTINMMPQVLRAGIPLTIKDVTGHGATYPISVVTVPGETVDELSPYPIAMDFGGAKFGPVQGGYTVLP